MATSLPAARATGSPAAGRRVRRSKGDDGVIRRDYGDDDVEGHSIARGGDELASSKGDGFARSKGDDGVIRRDYGDDDVEGHSIARGGDELQRGSLSTQGEFLRKGPGDNPHGDH